MVLGQVSRAFLYRDRITFLKLYTPFIRIRYSSLVTLDRSDIEILEKVQRRAVNLIADLQGVGVGYIVP